MKFLSKIRSLLTPADELVNAAIVMAEARFNYVTNKELVEAMTFKDTDYTFQALSYARASIEHLKALAVRQSVGGSVTVREVSGRLSDAMENIEVLRWMYEAFNSETKHDSISPVRESLISMLRDGDKYGNVDMTSFRGKNYRTHGEIPVIPVTASIASPDEINACGTTACLSGHMRLNAVVYNRYRLDQRSHSAQIVTLCSGEGRVLPPNLSAAIILGVPIWFADMMIYNRESSDDAIHRLYLKPFVKVTGGDVADILQHLRDGWTAKAIFDAKQTIHKSILANK